MEAQFQMVPVSELSESPLNPRKGFDETKLAELTASVKEKGVLEPLLVRPTKDGFEVAAGARRYRAAKAAGLKQLPAMVREMSDAELLEVAILENVVRSDITPLEEGEAYRQLTKDHGYTIEQLVEKTGKSRTVVFQRMKLAALQGPARLELERGHLSPSVAELIARLPTPASQDAAMKRLEEKKHWRAEHLGEMPFREAKEVLEEEFRLQLKSAPFDVKSTELVPSAPACGECPKRTGADKELFPGVKLDTCLDAVCWGKKKAAAFRELKAELKEDGKALVSVGSLYSQYDKTRLADAVRAKYAAPTEKVDGEKTWKQLLGDVAVPVVTVIDKEHQSRQLVDRAAALELLKEKDPKAARKLETDGARDDWKKAREKRDREHLEHQLVAGAVRRAALGAKLELEQVVALYLSAVSVSSWDWSRLLELAGLPAKTAPEKLKPADVAKVMLVQAMSQQRVETVSQVAKLVKVDLKAVRRKAAAAEKGTCFVCGCTPEKACDGGCSWVDDTQLLCSKCEEV